MTIYDLSLPTETVQKLEGIINAILTDKATELQTVQTELASTKAEFAAYQSAAQQAITAAQAAIKDSSLDDAATVQAIADVVTNLTADDETKRKAEIQAKIDALKKELDT